MPVNLVVGSNSYIDIAAADQYFSERLYAQAWNITTDDLKAQALIMATRRIDSLPLKGKKLNINQALAFPRYAYKPNIQEYLNEQSIFPDYTNYKICDRIKRAVCEEALALLKGIPKRIELQQQGVKQAQVGNITEVYTNEKFKLLSADARDLMRPYIVRSVRII